MTVKIYKQASAIPFRYRNDKLEILIITSRNKKNWIIPKGMVENGDSEVFTAKKESIEEAGVTGKVLKKKVGTYSYKKLNGLCRVNVYPLKVKDIFDQWDEMDFRIRKWVDPKEAIVKVKPRQSSDLIKKFIRDKKNKWLKNILTGN